MRSLVCTTVLAAMTLVAGCRTDKSGGSGGPNGGTVIASMGSDAASLFPLVIEDETGKAITDLLFDHLAEIGDNMATIGDAGFEPRLAKSWDWGKDSLTITFHLDPAARFHDGEPVRASDVRYSLNLIKNPALASPFAPLVSNVDSVSVVDSVTAKFWFKKHLPEEFYDVAYQVAVVPEHIYGKVAPADMKTADVVRHPVGSGRFRFAKWDAASRIELLADTANYRGRAKLDRVVFLLEQPPAASAAGVLTGESDFYIAFPTDQAPRLDSSAVARGIPYAQMAYGFFGMRLHDRKSKTRPHPILSETAVRRAISMSLDRKGMLANVFNKAGLPAYGPFPTSVATADTSVRVPPYDTTAAKALLDSAGWKPGPDGIRRKNGRPLSFEIMIPTSSSIRVRYGDFIQEQLKQVGIHAELSKVPAPAFIARQSAGDFDAELNLLSTDPSSNGAKQYWTSEGDKSGFNYLTYSNPKVEALLDSAGRATDLASNRRFAIRAYQTIADDVPAVWLYNGSTIAAVNRRIETAPLRPDGWWAHLADWSVPADKRIDRDRVGLRPRTP